MDGLIEERISEMQSRKWNSRQQQRIQYKPRSRRCSLRVATQDFWDNVICLLPMDHARGCRVELCSHRKPSAGAKASYSLLSIVTTSSQLRHWKVMSVGSPPSLGVIRAAFIVSPQDGQHGLFSASFSDIAAPGPFDATASSFHLTALVGREVRHIQFGIFRGRISLNSRRPLRLTSN